MKSTFYAFSLGFLALFTGNTAFSQGLAVNTTGASPTASAMLDVTSTSKGMLIPRMTNAQRNAISAPATGLMVFQTDGTAGFYYFDGSSWTSIGGGATGTAGGDLSGTYPNPTVASLGAISGANLTSLTPGNLTSGGTFPAENGSNLTNLNGSNVATGTIPVARLGSGSGSATTFLNGTGAFSTPSGGSGVANGYFLMQLSPNMLQATEYYGIGNGSNAATLNNFIFASYMPAAITIDEIDILYYDAGSNSGTAVAFALQHGTPASGQANSWTTSSSNSPSITTTGSATIFTSTIAGPISIAAGEVLQIRQTNTPTFSLSCGTCKLAITTKYH